MSKGGSNLLLAPKDAAARLGVSRKTLDRNWRDWGLKRIVLSARAVRFRERDLENFIQSRLDESGIESRTFEV